MRYFKLFFCLLILFLSSLVVAKDKKILKSDFRTGSYLNIGRTLSSNNNEEALSIDARADLNYFIVDKFSLGPVLRYEYFEATSGAPGIAKQDEFTLGVTSNYYFSESRDWVMLAGLGILTKLNDKEIIYNLHLGAEYFISENISVGPKLIYENIDAESNSQSRDAISFFTGFYFYL